MALDDVVKAVLVEDEGIGSIFHKWIVVHKDPQQLLGPNVTDERFTKFLESLKSRARDYAAAYAGEPAADGIVAALFGEDKKATQSALNVLLKEESKRVKDAVQNKGLVNYVSAAFDAATAPYAAQFDKRDKEEQDRLKATYDYSKLSQPLQNLVNDVVATGQAATSHILMYVALEREPHKVLGQAATKDEIESEKKKHGEKLEAAVNAYFSSMSEEIRKDIIEKIKSGDESYTTMIASIESALLVGVSKTVPDDAKANIGYSILRNKAIARGVVKAEEIPEDLAKYKGENKED